MKTNSTFFLILLFFLPMVSFAGNIQVSNVNLTNQNTATNTYQVEFDLSWENSWRTNTLESNWDAAWVVIKFRETPSTTWEHANIFAAGTIYPAGFTGSFGGDDGLFIFRDSPGIGDVNIQNMSVRWNYASSFPDDAIIEVCVLAMEMVYIPEGAYELGDDSPTPSGNFQAGITTNPYTISSEAALTLGGSISSNLNVRNANNNPPDDYNSSTTQSLPAAYPKGFAAFYIMKYELSQGQYAEFLNKLPTLAATNRFPNQNGQSGHTISNTGNAPEFYIASSPERACNFLSWPDLASYADWIALRPMSELEYEKACRGSRPAVPDEKAWGSPFLSLSSHSIANVGAANESIFPLPQNTGNASFSSTNAFLNRPYRCGIFAFSAINKTREETGASYYGVMELSGNLWEPVITTGDPEGRTLSSGTHGNGIVNSSGDATIGPTWPNVSGGSIGLGSGLRGGGYNQSPIEISVSNRDLVNFGFGSRFSDVGGRLVRTAP